MELKHIPPPEEHPNLPRLGPGNIQQRILEKGLQMGRRDWLQSRWSRFIYWLRGYPRRLLDLNDYRPQIKMDSSSDIGFMEVPIHLIIGSEGRARDFDGSFHLKNEHLRSRWVRVAMARQQGQPVPPVQLIQIGTHYFVRDGHHRISVAHWLGEEYISAYVTRWLVSHPLPWVKSGTMGAVKDR